MCCSLLKGGGIVDIVGLLKKVLVGFGKIGCGDLLGSASFDEVGTFRLFLHLGTCDGLTIFREVVVVGEVDAFDVIG